MEPFNVVWFGIGALPVVVGLVQILKQVGLPSRWSGLAAVMLGAGGGGAACAFTLDEISCGAAIVQGVVVGLAASGAWSVSKNSINNMRNAGQP